MRPQFFKNVPDSDRVHKGVQKPRIKKHEEIFLRIRAQPERDPIEENGKQTRKRDEKIGSMQLKGQDPQQQKKVDAGGGKIQPMIYLAQYFQIPI